MLTENDVVAAVRAHLEMQHYKIIGSKNTLQHGIDIEAERADGTYLRIEAKGQTSTKEGSPRHGKPFTNLQCSDHVAKAIFTALKLRQAYGTKESQVGIALPADAHHQKYIEQVNKSLTTLEIRVFWVLPDKTVREGIFGTNHPLFNHSNL